MSYNHLDDGHAGGDVPRLSADGTIVPLHPVVSYIIEGNKEARLLSEWLGDSIPPYAYFTVQCCDDQGPHLKAFQLLSCPRRVITIETFDSNAPLEQRMFNLLPLELWHTEL